jgi:hypothetical protein
VFTFKHTMLNMIRLKIEKKNDKLLFVLFLMKKNNQSFSNSKTMNKMNIENDFVRDENIKNVVSHVYVNLIVKTKILFTKKLVFAIQTKTFHVRFEFKSFEIKKQHEKFKKTFRLVIDETKNVVSRKTIKKIVSKNINFTKLLIELRIVLKILQKSDQFIQKKNDLSCSNNHYKCKIRRRLEKK